jgi:hypothetical protein
MLEHCIPNFSIGSILFQMMESQQIRAQDSTGVAIFKRDKWREIVQAELF